MGPSSSPAHPVLPCLHRGIVLLALPAASSPRALLPSQRRAGRRGQGRVGTQVEAALSTPVGAPVRPYHTGRDAVRSLDALFTGRGDAAGRGTAAISRRRPATGKPAQDIPHPRPLRQLVTPNDDVPERRRTRPRELLLLPTPTALVPERHSSPHPPLLARQRAAREKPSAPSPRPEPRGKDPSASSAHRQDVALRARSGPSSDHGLLIPLGSGQRGWEQTSSLRVPESGHDVARGDSA
ncbi:hypothetical protein CDD83_5716 [Cordyceps sp. RAO-2017]|nr:hypothetical protein CDD83_5716 [Cordyceps sp. RAO-2017]